MQLTSLVMDGKHAIADYIPVTFPVYFSPYFSVSYSVVVCQL